MAAATTAGNAAGESSTGAQTQSPEQPLNTQAQADEMNMEGKIDIAAKEPFQNHVDEPKLSQLPEQSNLERMIFGPSQQVTSNENIKYNLNQNGQNDIEDNKEEVTRPNMPMLN
ncbi:hypothetical protein OKZ62_004360 [Vibrio navarrensis]|nr:hypothetical protein [Vibrio navarrensis]